MKSKRSISFQITITVVLAFTLVFCCFVLLTTNHYRKNTSSLMQESWQHSLSQLNESYDVFYQQLIYILIQLSEDSTLKQYMTHVPKDNFEYYQMQRYVHDFLQSYTGFFQNSSVNIILYGENDQTYSSYNETLHLEDTNILEEEFVIQSQQNHRRIGITYSHKGITPDTSMNDYVYLAHALYDPYRSRYYGIILVTIDESCFKNLYCDLISSDNRISILTDSGLVLSDSRQSASGYCDKELLKLSTLSSGKIADYQGEKWQITSVYNEYFDFYLLQLTRFSSLTARINAPILRLMELCLLIWLVITVLIIFMLRKITLPIRRLSQTMQNATSKELLSGQPRINFYGCAETQLLGDSFYSMLDRLERYTNSLIKAQKAQHIAELNSLQHQINPHFIYNTLTSIKYLSIAGQRDKVISGINSLSKLLHNILGDANMTVPLKQELSLLSEYFQIQQLRYGDGIRFQICIPDEYMDFLVPRFILQPLVENSIFHGFSTNAPNGTISLFATIHNFNQDDDQQLILELIDNGVGIEPEVLKTILTSSEKENTSHKIGSGSMTRIGIKNIDERIRLIYGAQYGLSITSTLGCGTQVTIRLPALHEKGEKSH